MQHEKECASCRCRGSTSIECNEITDLNGFELTFVDDIHLQGVSETVVESKVCKTEYCKSTSEM